MSDSIAPPDLFAPAGGWRVRILDQTGGAEDGIIEDIAGFPTLMQANAFARAYVRDSVELCRAPNLSPQEILARWHAMGEDAQVLEAGEQGWQSTPELADFAARPARAIDRDWRSLDPRKDDESDG